MIIGLTGLQQAGKDTVAAYLVKERGYERRAFADPLKKSVAALFDIPFSEVDKLKLDQLAGVMLSAEWNDQTHATTSSVPKYALSRFLTFREFLQRYGTEAHRDIPEMGEDFWVELTLPTNGYYVNRNIVISDVRFENEVRRIHHIHGIVVEIQRPGLSNEDPHRSEAGTGVEPDYAIFNDGTIEDLGKSVDTMLDHFNAQL